MPLYAFDGTWNERLADDAATPELETLRNTNVVRFLEAYDGKCTHFNGIGTRVGALGRAMGGIFGVGGRQRVAEAIADLRADACEDGSVDVVGFSRGAALALSFANRLADQVPDGRPLRIRCLALFDVVGAFGLPFDLGPLKFQAFNPGHELTLPPSVDYCFHALALDERRHTFRPTRVAGACEVWFRGAHGDVGGGNGNVGLNAIALCWMLRKAAAAGLPIRDDAIRAAAAAANPLAPVAWPAPDPIANGFRRVRPTDRVHHTVMRPCRTPGYNDAPAECPTEDAACELRAEPVARSAV